MENLDLIPFQGERIRRTFHEGEWYFSIIDILEMLIDTNNAQSYWGKLKEREPQLLTICQKFKFAANDGKMRSTDCANTEGVLRIVMSVPSPKAEPLKLWLAEQGKRTLDETADPELLTQRQIDLYKAKGYTDEWIKERLKSIETRNKLTDEWQQRGVKEGREYSILTAIIAKGTFGVTPTEHREVKNLTKSSQNLRDNMTDLELIFTALGEAATRQLAIEEDAQGFDENKDKAVKGGKGAGIARENFEKATGLKVVSANNFLDRQENLTVLPLENNDAQSDKLKIED
jgi:DNA-damage-inducible protein D